MNNKELFESCGKAIVGRFVKGITEIAQVFKRKETLNCGYIKQFEKRELYSQINITFSSPIIKKRYDDICTALKYTKHSKKRERLLKAKRMYEKHLIVEG
ncbi:hypothetical protein [Lysinibacillus varians]|uniref:Uncharacterized protein n=1 Tax=Lysinibacillus varians TaxID=1145276 RepID=A0ABY2TEF3_9BACI|nr:hypothetical protein [Lysinibacillus varians]AHN24364.1 hypothetical protein T479_16285 [Lysinibacillus varians]TKI66103.1 hypothetical protein FC752_05930 [Lysinibacillus varians]